MRIKQNYKDMIFCAVSGSAAAVSFPKADLFFLIWVAFVPLFIVLMKGRVKTSFFYALFAGLVFNAA
ncbi:MAG: hypothetical protein LBU09_04735, partial [Endomicrobium sp.]|nr:hypothetical protein [Endomicrobium sp.]